MSEGPVDIEDDVLARLADLGLVVPTRDPNRQHTKTELRCWKWGVVGVKGAPKGGKPFKGRHPCKRPGCEGCVERWAEQEMSGLVQAEPDFVGIGPVYRQLPLAYTAKPDKIPALWVATVPTPPESVGTLSERLGTRTKRQGGVVKHVVIPCDGAAILVADADLAGRQTRGRPPLAPTSGWWLPLPVVHLFVRRVLQSRAVRGQIRWPEGWEPLPPEKPKSHTISGPPHIVDTAWAILHSEGYVHNPNASPWDREDPVDRLLDARRRAAKFWADPRCSECSGTIARSERLWWHESRPFCGICDLAIDLGAFMTTGRTEREIERYLRPHRLIFRRHRGLIEQALRRTGAEKQRTGIWSPRRQGEEAV